MKNYIDEYTEAKRRAEFYMTFLSEERRQEWALQYWKNFCETHGIVV